MQRRCVTANDRAFTCDSKSARRADKSCAAR